MKTTLTSGQLSMFLTLLEQKGVTPESFQKRLENGVLADIFHPEANIESRNRIRSALDLFPAPKVAAEMGKILLINPPAINDIHLGKYLRQNSFEPLTLSEVLEFAAGSSKDVDVIMLIAYTREPGSLYLYTLQNGNLTEDISFVSDGANLIVKKAGS